MGIEHLFYIGFFVLLGFSLGYRTQAKVQWDKGWRQGYREHQEMYAQEIRAPRSE